MSPKTTLALLLAFLAACGGEGRDAGGAGAGGSGAGGSGGDDSNRALETLELLYRGQQLLPFDPSVESYEVEVGFLVSDVMLRVVPTDPASQVRAVLNGLELKVSSEETEIDLLRGESSLLVEVTQPEGTTTTYTTRILRGSAPIEQAYLKGSAPQIGAHFGEALALDRGTLVVGAPEADARGGVVHVFTRGGDSWSQTAVLHGSNTEGGDLFGAAVAISRDTIVVGAPSEDGDAADPGKNTLESSGAAYVFVRSGSTWTERGYLKAPNVGDFDRFGSSVAIDGDTLVVGADGEDGDGSSPDNDDIPASGAAYVFARSASAWVVQDYLKASYPDEFDRFGSEVAIESDTLVVTATLEDGDGSSEQDNSVSANGAAYVFGRNGQLWSQEAYLKEPGASTVRGGEHFGNAVDISGEAIVIGARNNGEVYVFAREGASWSRQGGTLRPPVDALEENFGRSVSIDGDFILVGDDWDNGDGSPEQERCGAAYLFSRNGSRWGFEHGLKASNAGAGDYFAEGVIDGEDIVVGAHLEDGDGSSPADNSSKNAGAAYSFR